MRISVLVALVPTLVRGPAAVPVPIAITHVTVIDVVSGRELRDRTVVISGHRVASVQPGSAAHLPVNARRIEGRGRYLIPGLWDMHSHPNFAMQPDDSADGNARRIVLPLELAHGVTGVRVMSGDCVAAPGGACEGRNRFDRFAQWRRDITAGRLAGPVRWVISTVFVDGAHTSHPGSISVVTPEQARAVVREAKRRGFDLVKVYNTLTPENFHALADEARRAGIPIAGHVPNLVGPAEASDAGMRSEEHLFGIQEGCAANPESLYAARRRWSAPEQRDSLLAVMDVQDTLPYDGPNCAALFATFRRNGTWITPTYGYQRADIPASYVYPPRLQDNPALRWIPVSIRERWEKATGQMLARFTPAIIADSRRVFADRLATAGRLRRAGVGLLAGTDSDNPYVVPGASLHDELAWLVAGGLTPLEALRTATLHPAMYLGATDSLGSIAPGKLADLVVLDADPLTDIRNTRRIAAVVANGRYFDRRALDSMLAGVAAVAAGH